MPASMPGIAFLFLYLAVATIEAMKMENSLTSAVSGTVKEIRVQKGAQVATGDVIMVFG